MRIGVAGLMPSDIKKVDSSVAKRIRNQGFSGVSCFFSEPFEVNQSDLHILKSVLENEGIMVAQCNAKYECLINPDESIRIRGGRKLQKMCQITHILNGHNLYVRPGSLNPGGQWWPHPENHSKSTIDRLIKSLKEVSSVAESEGIYLALEGHVVSTLDTPERVREIILAVDSPALKFNVDPVNFIGRLQDAYNTTNMLNRLFDQLGEFTIAAHAKDVYVENRHVLHISETIPLDGLLDYETFLKRFEASCPDGYMLIEHLSEENIPKAKGAIDSVVRQIGLKYRE